MPAAGVGALTFRSGAHAVAVGLSVLPTAAIGPAVVKVESTSVNLRTIRRHGGGTGRARLRRAYATCLRQLSAPRHPVWRPGRLLAGLLLHLSRLSQALSFDFLVSLLRSLRPRLPLFRLRLDYDRYCSRLNRALGQSIVSNVCESLVSDIVPFFSLLPLHVRLR